LGNCGLIGAFSSTSDKADIVLTTNGDILYYNNGRQRLPKEDNDDVLTLKSGLPSWEPAAGGGQWELLDTTELTSATNSYTFTPSSAPTEAAYASFVVIVSSENSTTGQYLTLEINNITSGYYTDGAKFEGGSTTNWDLNASAWRMGVTSTQGSMAQSTLILGDASFSSEYPQCFSFGTHSDLSSIGGGKLSTTATTLTKLIVKTTGGNMGIGTKITTFGVKRT